jgi:arsenical pump membrane protein
MTNIAIWIIAGLSIGGVIFRPYKFPEAVWAIGGASVLILCTLISAKEALNGFIKGADVYLFLTGMMLLAETAREEQLFDWLAAYATRMAKGSYNRLFLLIYLVGILVTAFLSNDATAVVLTPAVAAATKAAKIKNPLPYLFICAFIANAASFVLPISNPANLVIYQSHMPPLSEWLRRYSLPSVCAIVITYLMLYLTQRKSLKQEIETEIAIPVLSKGGKTALLGIGMTAVILITASALNIELGLPTAITGILTSSIVIIIANKKPWVIIKGVSWSVLMLVAGLFVIVEALDKTGMIQELSTLLHRAIGNSTSEAAWGAGLITAYTSNLVNNLPAGLVAGHVVQHGQVPELIKSSILIGIDLGPNLSVTGSLATILWLVALKREGLTVSAWTFLKIGLLVMTIALLVTLASLWI